MRNNGKGGMQTSSPHPTLICPKCGKSAAMANFAGTKFMHFTDKGAVWHIWDGEKWISKRAPLEWEGAEK